MAAGGGSELLGQEEIDNLLEAAESGDLEMETQKPGQQREAIPYNFKRPERVSGDQLRSLEMLHEVYARNLGASLSGHLRSIVEARLEAVEQLTYTEFIMSMANPTFFNVIKCSPLDGRILLEMNPSIIYPIYDRLMGGGNLEAEIPDRALTDIEWEIIGGILERALNELEEVWNRVQEIQFSVEQQESNPHLVQIIPPNELVILISLEIIMGDHSGMMNLCVPFTVLEPMIAKLTPQTWYGLERGEEEETEKRMEIADAIQEAGIEMVGTLLETTITVEDLLNLDEGDQIITEKQQDESVKLRIGGEPVYSGKPGVQQNGRLAVKIREELENRDSLLDQLEQEMEKNNK